MTQRRRIAVVALASLAGLAIILVVAATVVVQTDWFRNYVREKIVTSVEEATGGTVEVSSFRFEPAHLRATVRGFVIHGLEPANMPPLFRARLLQVDLKVLPRNGGIVDISYLLVDTPQANIMVFPDGHTNIPAPKLVPKSNNKTGLETIVDLAIGRFDLRNGSIRFDERTTKLNASGGALNAQLGYNPLIESYKGEIDIAPLEVQSDGNPALNVNVKLPLTAGKDKITLSNAQLSTAQSKVVVTASVDHLIAPHTAVQINADVALDEAKRALGLDLPLDTAHGPRHLTADVRFASDDRGMRIEALRAKLGESDIEASGNLSDRASDGAVGFRSTLALGELGRLLRVTARPQGTLKVSGQASLPANGQYRVTSTLSARNVAIRQGATRLSGIALDAQVTADQRRMELTNVRLVALGGGFRGSASVEDWSRFHLAGNLQNFGLAQIMRVFGDNNLGYDGMISGSLQADGSLRSIPGIAAKTDLTITPAHGGIPVSGRLTATYNGHTGAVTLDRVHLALPHTTADLSGSLGSQIQVHLVTRGLEDFRPLGVIPVAFNSSGSATVTATVSGSLSDPHISGQAAFSDFAVDGRPFSQFSTQFAASKASTALNNAVLRRGALQAEFTASAALDNWKPAKAGVLRADLNIQNADIRDVLALGNSAAIPVTGTFNADAHIQGTMGSPTGAANVAITRGTAEGEPFDSLKAQVIMSPTSVSLSSLSLISGASRLEATANYRHAVNDLSHGELTSHVATNQMQLAQFQMLVKGRPGLRGLANLNLDVSATLNQTPGGTDFRVSAITCNAAIRNLELETKSLGDLTATANSSGSVVQYNISSNLAGSTIRVDGQSSLIGDHDTNANATIANLPVDRILALAGYRDVPLKGTLSANAKVSGTMKEPRGTGAFTITKGTAYEEPFDRLQASVTYSDVLIDLSQFRVDDGPSSLDLTGSFRHPAGQLTEGQVEFRVKSNDVDISRIHTIAAYRPGLAGIVQLTANGAATLHSNAPVSLSGLSLNLAAHNLSRNGKNLGSLNATANSGSNAVEFEVNSDLGKARFEGKGRLGLANGYPVDAKVNFDQVTWSGLSPLLAASAQPFDGTLGGQLSVSGATTDLASLHATLELTKFEAHSVATAENKKPRVQFEMHNSGSIRASLANAVVTVQNFSVTGPYTNLTLSGGLSLKGTQTVSMRANGILKLEMFEAFDSDMFSSGGATLNASLSGSLARPTINGRLQIQNASFNLLSAPNGLSNANGAISFNGIEAEIQNVTGQTGGGKVTLAGSVSYGGPEMQFRVQATASQIHLDYPDTVTTEADARLTLTGKTSSSLLSGNVSIRSIALHSQSDVGSILSSAAVPPSPDTGNSGLLAGMRFDVHIQTIPGVQFRTSLAQNLQGDATLTLRGTPKNPGMLGRFAVSSGDLVFFGASYTVDQATVSFYNPNKIDPVINADLETTVQGVDVTLSVSGRIDKLKLSYRSDPPLEFSQIVSLLASGKSPTTDPVLAAHEPVAPEQNFEQVGASTVLGQAVASPISGRLQRLFGVSKLSIDPQIVGNTSNNPQATLTLQQQVTRNLTFTYIQDVSSSNPTAIRIEWAISPRFSAVAQRDIYGEFALDFVYKKRFH